MDLSSFSRYQFDRGRGLGVRCLWALIGPALGWALLPSRARVLLLRMFGANVGKGVRLSAHMRVRYPWRLSIRENSWIGDGCWIDNWVLVAIGANVCVSQQAYLCTGNHDWADPSFAIAPRPIAVSDGAWVGARAVLGPGVEMGTGSIAAIGSVILRHVPAWEVHGGNPAVKLCDRIMRQDSRRLAVQKAGTVVVAGPTRSRGGITTVVDAHKRLAPWREFGCVELNTFSDANVLAKIGDAVGAYVRAPLLLMKARLVHMHLAGRTSMLRKLPLLGMAVLLRCVVVIHLHIPDRRWILGGPVERLFRLFCRASRRIVVLSPYWKEQLETAGITTQIQVIPNAVSSKEMGEMNSSRVARVLFVGKLEKRKGYDDLLHAAGSVLRTRPDVEFLFAGHGELARAAALARDLGIESSVQFLGWTTGEQLAALYRSATVFCLPSYAEGLPMSLLEAMSYGLPVIATPVGGIPGLIEHEKNGFLIKPGNRTELSQRLLFLLGCTPKQRQIVGASARDTISRLCSEQAVSDSLSALYRDFIPQDPKAAPTQKGMAQSHRSSAVHMPVA